jgi:hypothetical protein
MMTKQRKPTKREIDSLESIIGRLEHWQYTYPERANWVASGKRQLMEAVSQMEKEREAK